MATSPIYNWPEPDNTDLVKNGALAIRTLGNAIDTTMGTMTPKSIVDAKGDLIAASANDTPARLAVGADGTTLVADSSTSTGLRYTANFAAGKNKIINGDFGIWQRGTTFTNPADGSYTSDRFQIGVSGTPTTYTVSRQTFTPGTAPVAGYEGLYFYRSAQTTLGTLTNVDFWQKIENVQTLAGQTVTLSFWAKADSTRNLGLYVAQNFGSGGSGTTFPLDETGSPASVTTSWQRFSYTFTMTSISGKTIGTNSYVQIAFRQAAAAGYVLDIWGLQLEAGNTATAFQTATGTIQGELAACQRYYQVIASGTSKILGVGYYVSATGIDGPIINLPVEMRTTPTISIVSGTNYFLSVSAGGGNDNLNSVTLASESTNRTAFFYNNSEAAGTAGQGCRIQTNNAAAFLAVQAEL